MDAIRRELEHQNGRHARVPETNLNLGRRAPRGNQRVPCEPDGDLKKGHFYP